jgi:hypothetical protein
MIINLEWFEYSMASEVGRSRQLSSIRRSLTDRHGFNGLGWSEHIEGACGELAAAKALDVYWNGSVDTFKTADLSTNIHIRTRSRHDYDLIVREKDPEDATYILVTGKCPTYTIQGFISGFDAKNDQWLQEYGNRPAAFFVPAVHLHPIEALIQQLPNKSSVGTGKK